LNISLKSGDVIVVFIDRKVWEKEGLCCKVDDMAITAKTTLGFMPVVTMHVVKP
jgi:hypothetical protein